jgi:hypothetical protein
MKKQENDFQQNQIVVITFYRNKNRARNEDKYIHKPEQIKQIQIPRWLYDLTSTKDRINWIHARLQYFNYGYHVQHTFSTIDKRTQRTETMQIRLDISTKQGTITKYKNKLSQWVENWQPTLLEQNYEDMQVYKDALQKIKKAEFELQTLQSKLEEQLSQTV